MCIVNMTGMLFLEVGTSIQHISGHTSSKNTKVRMSGRVMGKVDEDMWMLNLSRPHSCCVIVQSSRLMEFTFFKHSEDHKKYLDSLLG